MSEREEGELDSGEEESATSPTETSRRMNASSSVTETQTVEDIQLVSKKNNDRRPSNDTSRRPRQSSKSSAHAFNEISNAKQKFVSRRSKKDRFDLATPFRPNFASSSNPVPLELSPTKPSDSWRPNPLPVNIAPEMHTRRPLLPNPFESPVHSFPPRPAFFNPPPVRQSFAPPPYNPSNPFATTFFNFSQPQPLPKTGEPAEKLASRHSVDMDISPVESPDMMENCVMTVDEPLDECDTQADQEQEPDTISGINDAQPTVPFVAEPAMYSFPHDAVFGVQTAQAPPKKLEKKFSKKFLGRLQSVLLENLYEETSSSSASSEYEEDEKEIDDLRRKLVHHNHEMHSELDKREKLVKEMETCQLMINHHYERMNSIMKSIGDASRQSVRHARKSLIRSRSEGKRKRKNLWNKFEDRVTALIDEMATMNDEVEEDPQEDSSTPKEKSQEQSNEVFEDLVEDSGMEFMPSFNESPSSVHEPLHKAGKEMKVDKLFEDEYLKQFFKARYGIAPLPHVTLPTRRASRNSKSKALNKNANLQKEAPVPPVVLPVDRASKTSKSKDLNGDANLEKEEALRRKLLEQMKKKSTPIIEQANALIGGTSPALQRVTPEIEKSAPIIEKTTPKKAPQITEKSTSPIHKAPPVTEKATPVTEKSVPKSEKPKIVKEQKTLPKDSEVDANDSDVEIIEVVTNQPPPHQKVFKPSDVFAAVVPVKAEERANIVPTMQDIIELKKELKIALNKRKKSGNKPLDPKVTISTPKESPQNPKPGQNDAPNVISPIKLSNTVVLPSKPMEKENVESLGIRPLKRRAPPPENDEPFKRAASVPQEKSSSLDEMEKITTNILFDSPRIAVRNFILSPEYPIKASIERLRHNNDPNIELCYFELFGICNDEECQYQHERDFTLNDQQILEEILAYIPERSTRSETIQQQAQKLLQSNSLETCIFQLRKETANLNLIELAISQSYGGEKSII